MKSFPRQRCNELEKYYAIFVWDVNEEIQKENCKEKVIEWVSKREKQKKITYRINE